ncbi:MAG: hypothetical protein KA760_04655 [Steroidobacteraceae bacterium]|jgi:hypothetical protein|nr:hypothetical protein [Pseudomonadota bacterium]MBP7608761.1 hypothetical protein [Steroidobacteraceae bacterium]MBP9129846.1 hypothetical protein [Steroidobacteraceae bacterium]
MAMHTDAALRFPAWLIAASVVVGVALGLWQVGVFDRSTHGESGASAHAAAGQLRNPARTVAADVTAGAFASSLNRVSGREAERPINTIDQPAGEPDPEVRAESDALQAALAAEQASH